MKYVVTKAELGRMEIPVAVCESMDDAIDCLRAHEGFDDGCGVHPIVRYSIVKEADADADN